MPANRKTALLLSLIWLTANSTTFANEPALADAEARIDAAFTKHLQYFNTEMYRRLRKDEDGNNDTYVLYDVQMHMQNAAIYADEQGDQEMLGKLLALCLIPFEPQHMTDGKWLNNTHHLVGIEVDLCIAQYFSLLTRVLSACERHGIENNFSDENIQIVVSHIEQWLAKPVNRNRVDDRHLFFVQSALQFYDYMKNVAKPIANIDAWKQYVQAYMAESIAPKWEVAQHIQGGRDYDCWMLDRTGWASYRDYDYAGYGSEITKTSSDTDPNAMFRADGTIKQPKKKVSRVGTDISHARRFNWFFETVKRFGKSFDVSIPEEALEGWANNLAFRVARGTLDDPHFTVFSDGVDGWYRVGYKGRKSYGYTLGDMDLHFVASSYGFFGVYNPRIYDWMNAWASKNKKVLAGYHGGYALDYHVSRAINMKKPLKGVD